MLHKLILVNLISSNQRMEISSWDCVTYAQIWLWFFLLTRVCFKNSLIYLTSCDYFLTKSSANPYAKVGCFMKKDKYVDTFCIFKNIYGLKIKILIIWIFHTFFKFVRLENLIHFSVMLFWNEFKFMHLLFRFGGYQIQ